MNYTSGQFKSIESLNKDDEDKKMITWKNNEYQAPQSTIICGQLVELKQPLECSSR